jgi:hypothetical protein
MHRVSESQCGPEHATGLEAATNRLHKRSRPGEREASGQLTLRIEEQASKVFDSEFLAVSYSQHVDIDIGGQSARLIRWRWVRHRNILRFRAGLRSQQRSQELAVPTYLSK